LKKLRTYNQLSEEELQICVSEKDEMAVEFIYNKNKQMIFSLGKKYGSGDEIEDIYQEAMLVLVNTLYEKKLNCKMSTFLYSVARNIVLKKLRNKPILENVENLVEVNDEIEDYNKYEQKRKTLQSALERIGERCKSILTLFYIETLSMENIANKLGYTNSENAKNQKYKCMKKLRKEIYG